MANENDSKRGASNRVKDVENQAEAGASNAVQSVREFTENAAEKYQEYSDQAAEKYQQGRQQVNQFIDELRDRAENEPLKTVLMAAGVGVVIGVLFG